MNSHITPSISSGVSITVDVGVTGTDEIVPPVLQAVVNQDWANLATQFDGTTPHNFSARTNEAMVEAFAHNRHPMHSAANPSDHEFAAAHTSAPPRSFSPMQQSLPSHSLELDNFHINSESVTQDHSLFLPAIDRTYQFATEPAILPKSSHHRRQSTSHSLSSSAILSRSTTPTSIPHNDGGWPHRYVSSSTTPHLGSFQSAPSSNFQLFNSLPAAASSVNSTPTSTQPTAFLPTQSITSKPPQPPLAEMTCDEFKEWDCNGRTISLRATKNKITKIKGYRCEACPRFFTRNSDKMKEHCIGTSDAKVKHFNAHLICPYCPNRPESPKLVCFQRKQTYERHVKQHRLGPEFECHFAPDGCAVKSQYATVKEHQNHCKWNPTKDKELEPRALREVKRSGTKRKTPHSTKNDPEESSVTSYDSSSNSQVEEDENEDDDPSEESKQGQDEDESTEPSPPPCKRNKKATPQKQMSPSLTLLLNPSPIVSTAVLVPTAPPPSHPEQLQQNQRRTPPSAGSSASPGRSSLIAEPVSITRGDQVYVFYPTRDMIPAPSRINYSQCHWCHTWYEFHESLSCICRVFNPLATQP